MGAYNQLIPGVATCKRTCLMHDYYAWKSRQHEIAKGFGQEYHHQKGIVYIWHSAWLKTAGCNYRKLPWSVTSEPLFLTASSARLFKKVRSLTGQDLGIASCGFPLSMCVYFEVWSKMGHNFQAFRIFQDENRVHKIHAHFCNNCSNSGYSGCLFPGIRITSVKSRPFTAASKHAWSWHGYVTVYIDR